VRGFKTHRLGKVDGLTVWLVDGERIRDDLEIDFTMGGTHARWKFIPKREVWIDECLSPRDRNATIVHELVERARMLKGASYEPAHDYASMVERAFRRRSMGKKAGKRVKSTKLRASKKKSKSKKSRKRPAKARASKRASEARYAAYAAKHGIVWYPKSMSDDEIIARLFARKALY